MPGDTEQGIYSSINVIIHLNGRFIRLLSVIFPQRTQIYFSRMEVVIITNVCSSDLDDHSNELHVFYSDDLLNGKWIPHADNPIIFDSNLARNGLDN